MSGEVDARLVIARGAREAEAYLLGELRRLHDEARADPALLGRPVRVVVPSRSLRDHLAGALVRSCGGAAAGIAIQTLRGAALETLERAGAAARGGDALVPVLVRRFAAAEPALAAALGGFDDGYAAALATVNDLLDAGLDASHAEPALECFAAAGAAVGAATCERAAALVRVAERVGSALDAAGLEARSGIFRRACDRLAADPAWLPTRALFFHGWADVTGVQLDWIEALLRRFAGEVVLDHPPDPADASAEGPGPRWTERLRVRVGGASRELALGGEPAVLDSFAAPGTHAEARAVARRVRDLLDEGRAPESIGIVLREPAPYRHALHAQLGRLGVPFSGSAGGLGPAGRRASALLELLARGEGCPADRWLDAQPALGREHRADLRLAFHGIGVGRLGDVARLDLSGLLGANRDYALPVRRGPGRAPSETADAEAAAPEADLDREPAGDPVLRRRRVKRSALEAASRAAAETLSRIAAVGAAGRLGAQLEELRRLLHRLGWRPDDGAAGAVYGALASLESELGADTGLFAEELVVLLHRAFEPVGYEPLGGAGAGVALLSAIEARGRSFSALFVMGMNRDVFPRLVREDALLPDALRRALESVMPDVPVKQRAEDEERYLFASLCSAAPSVTLSWLVTSDDGKERPVSPLIEALGPRLAPTVEPLALQQPGPRPAFEHALLAGFARSREGAEHALALALERPALAAARRAVVEALDVGDWAQPLGPFFGFVGAPGADDPRSAALSITRLEGMARCAWQSFLERVLRLEPPPDALAELPDATPLLVGNVVHAVLEQLVAEAGGAVDVPLATALARGGVRVSWPRPEQLTDLVAKAAQAAARAAGIVQPGFARLLALRARPLLDQVGDLDFASGGRSVLGAELRGSLLLRRADGSERLLSFRADRADPLDDGVALIDYKTGRPVSESSGADTRYAHLHAEVKRGTRLQGAAYAFAGGPVREGRYLFARPGVAPEHARVVIRADDDALRGAFDEATRELLAAYEIGAFPPRLLDANRQGRSSACDGCDVAEACLQGETGSRRHLAAWLDRHAAAPEPLPSAARAALALLLRAEG